MQVSGLSWDTFWKGETEIRGTAADGEETYRVRILIRAAVCSTTLVPAWEKRPAGRLLFRLLHAGRKWDRHVPTRAGSS